MTTYDRNLSLHNNISLNTSPKSHKQAPEVRSNLPDLDRKEQNDLGLVSDDISFYYQGEHFENLLKPWTKLHHFIPTVSTYGVTFLLGLVGNSLVLFAVLGGRKSRSTTSSFMVSLAVADLLFLLICVPSETAETFLGHWDTGSLLCKVSGGVEMLSALSSVLNLMAISIERCMVIVHPMKARTWCTVENTNKILPWVWVVALGLSAPTLYVWDTDHTVFYNNITEVTVVLCADVGVHETGRLHYAIYQFVVMLVLPVIVMFVCYFFVIRALWLSSRQLRKMTSHVSGYTTTSTTDESTASLPHQKTLDAHSCSSSRYCHIRPRRGMLNRVTREHSVEVLRTRKQVIKMLIAIVLVFLLCWGPKLLFSVFQRLGFSWIYSQWAYTLKIVITLLPFIHSCLNPIIYGFMSKNFRSRMKCACRKYIFRKSRNSVHRDMRQMASSDHELDMRSTNGTVQSKISGCSSQLNT